MGTDMLTADELSPLVRSHLGRDARCVSVTRGPVGNGQETWFLDIDQEGTRRELVLRRSAEGSTLEWTDRALEFAMLRALKPHGLPVPGGLWLERAPSSLRRPYFVMERAPGAPLRRLDEATRRDVSHQLGVLLARLHGLPLDRFDLNLPRPHDGAAAALEELARWRDRYRARSLAPIPLMGALLAWLEANPPKAPAPVVVLWGDPGPHNLLLAEGQVSAMLDWELAHLGHPLDDLGAAVWACLEVLDSERVVEAYEAERSVAVDRDALRWFVCLACVTRSVMLVEGVRAFVEGRTVRPGIAGLGLELLFANLERGAAAAGWGNAAGTRSATGADDAGEAPPTDLAPSPPRPTVSEIARGIARFLSEEVLGAVEERSLRHGLKVAAALLDTAAARADVEPALQARREHAARALLGELAEAGVHADDIEQAAAEVERRNELMGLRERVRSYLLEDLALVRGLLGPLHELYTSQRQP